MPCMRGTPHAMLLTLAGLMAPAQAWAQDSAGFDLDMLRERGIDPQIAEYFKDAARFRPGINVVTLFVNGQLRGRLEARFDDKGELCFDERLLDKGNLQLPQPSVAAVDGAGQDGAGAVCHGFLEAYPQTVVELRPGKEEVALVVPTESLRPAQADFSGYSSGGVAALSNYDIVASRSQFGQAGSSFMSANLEFGLNMGDWILRTREMVSRQENSSQRQHLYAYAQRTLIDYTSILQGGQINILNTAFAAGPITGIQLVPEAALSTGSLNTVMVEGIAQGQARIEVRQNSALIYSTIVPGGPFALTDLPLLNGTGDLDVTVIENNGAQRRFTVPAASLHGASFGLQRGISVALGKMRSLGNSTARQPWLLTASGGWALGKNSNLSAGIMAATGYHGLSWGLDGRLGANNLSFQQRLARASRLGQRGTQFSLGASRILADDFSLSLSTTQQTLGYRDLGDIGASQPAQDIPLPPTDPGAPASKPEYARYRAQYSATLGWNQRWLGGFSMSYSRSTQFNGSSTQRVMASWGRTFDFGTVNLNLERQLGSAPGSAGIGSRRQDGGNPTVFYLTLSIPLGKSSVRGYLNNSGGHQRMGTSFSQQAGDGLNYSIAAERSAESGATDLSAQASMLPRYTQVNLGYARSGSGSTSINGGLRGGMVLHKGGLTLSPYAVQDTFGVLQVGDIAGVKVNTPYGPVWTDWKGQAVVAQMAPYASTRLEIATRSLPRNVDLRNGLKQLDPGRGSVSHVDFEVLRVRRILLNARDLQKRPLPKGGFVLDADKQFVTTVVDDGQIFLLNVTPGAALQVVMPDEKTCRLHYQLPEKVDSEVFYEAVDAVCSPDMHVKMKGVPHAHS
ncbi:fimbria/pilus outer membrane usher protein [Herbaspirillum sp. YR522]|uniref:fimbria/pilus outer membrane usher protein n=1 Tax=Herbaspirillum sp. YR522 TaxID=1144342 RepID=UPI00026F7687|nr:fimbria/pilus outer membrane usher protein [Herbaspirillum sp. YR522]EJN07053.1 P pilus assembly protein, porin PapC [Herbaspirillum sp. YR522]